MPARRQDQLAMDELVVEDADLEQLLDDRGHRRASLQAVRKAYDEVHEQVVGKLASLDLEEGPVRIGRWRITKNDIAPKSIAFDTKASTRIRIVDATEDDE